MSVLSAQEIGSVAAEMRRIANKIILPVFDKRAPVKSHDKSGDGHNLVTDADTSAERALTEFLRKHWPHALIIGEEVIGMDHHKMPALQKDKGMVWILDPIDGTTNFTNKDPNFGVMVACVVDGVTQHAWIYCPRIYGGVMVSATKGTATYADYDNGKKEKLFAKPLPFDQTALGHYALYPDFTYNTPGRDQIDATLARHKRYKHSSMSAETVRMLIDGDIGIVYIHPKLWDRIPPALILSEAGGIAAPLSDLSRDLYMYSDDTPVVFTASREAAERLQTLFLGHAQPPAPPANGRHPKLIK